MNDLAAAVTTKSVDDTYSSDKDGNRRPAFLPSCDLLSKSSHDEAGGRSDSDSDHDLDDNNANPEDNEEEPCPIKRKQPSLSHDVLIQKKRKRHLKQRSTR
jgi:hypothetical protein